MSAPEIAIRAGDVWAECYAMPGGRMEAQATVFRVSDATAREIEAGVAFSALTLITPDGARVSVHLPPGVATRMAAAFHAPAEIARAAE